MNTRNQERQNSEQIMTTMNLTPEISALENDNNVLSYPSWDDRIAIWISGLFSPVIVAIFALFFIAKQADIESWRLGLYFTLAIFLPILYIFWLIRIGKLSDFHMNNHKQRIRPMLIIPFFIILAWGSLWFTSNKMDIFLVTTGIETLQILLYAVITMKWKISGHASTISTVAILMLGLYGMAAIPLVLAIPVVIWARVHLGRHTLAQTCSGAIIGAFFSLVAIFTTFIVVIMP
jgi:hypothetical protein